VLHFADSGEAALERLAGEIKPELIVILSDINMPGMVERCIAGCCLYDAVTAEGDLERRGVRPGSSLKTVGHEETGLRI